MKDSTASRHPHTAGFTSIELLVCISIVAFLISILIPALSSARANAQMIQCLSNLRQVEIASSMYQTDNDEHVFGRYSYPVEVAERFYYQQSLDRYLTSSGVTRTPNWNSILSKIWACPTNRPKQYANLQDLGYTDAASAGTLFNATATKSGGIHNGIEYRWGIQSSEVRSPSIYLLASEGRRSDINAALNLVSVQYSTYGFSTFQYAKHGEGSNFLMLDGHVAFQGDDTPYRSLVPSEARKVWYPRP